MTRFQLLRLLIWGEMFKFIINLFSVWYQFIISLKFARYFIYFSSELLVHRSFYIKIDILQNFISKALVDPKIWCCCYGDREGNFHQFFFLWDMKRTMSNSNIFHRMCVKCKIALTLVCKLRMTHYATAYLRWLLFLKSS